MSAEYMCLIDEQGVRRKFHEPLSIHGPAPDAWNCSTFERTFEWVYFQPANVAKLNVNESDIFEFWNQIEETRRSERTRLEVDFDIHFYQGWVSIAHLILCAF